MSGHSSAMVPPMYYGGNKLGMRCRELQVSVENFPFQRFGKISRVIWSRKQKNDGLMTQLWYDAGSSSEACRMRCK